MAEEPHNPNPHQDAVPFSPIYETDGIHGQRVNVNDTFLSHSEPITTSGAHQEIKNGATKKQASTRLHRSAFVLILVLVYALLALFAWVITSILTFRPIAGPKHYGVREGDPLYDDGFDAKHLNNIHEQSVHWYRAARVIQSIVSVLTIPVTSAVCSSAAVVFVQQHQKPSGLSIRQVMTLADKSWADPSSFARVIFSWKRYGTSFLLLAIFLNMLGGLISPLQEIFLSTTTKKISTGLETVSNLLDIPDQSKVILSDSTDNNFIVVLTRTALMTASNVQPQAQLWQGGSVSCGAIDMQAAITNDTSEGQIPPSCGNGMTFGNILNFAEPFLAELPNGFSTGLIRQFIPRINSTASYENITADEYPSGCDQIPGAFSVGYSGKDLYTPTFSAANWSIQACMPADQRQSPWQYTRDRQDFTEFLYLNVSIISNGDVPRKNTPPGGSFYRVTLNTTAGYFELPNYMNGLTAGPLLDKDPNNTCGYNCTTGSDDPEDIVNVDAQSSNIRRANDGPDAFNANVPNGSLALELVYNKGPLLTVSMALFGEGSLLATRVANPEVYYGLNYTVSDFTPDPINAGNCVDMAPLGQLFADSDWPLGNSIEADYCITNTYGSGWDSGPYGQSLSIFLLDWINNFTNDEALLVNVFTAAGYLANQAWMMNNVNSPSQRTLTISYDYGGDIQVPTLSIPGLIVISVLLALDLLALFVMAIYATYSPKWTNALDSFAMMRIGAVMYDKLPLMVGMKKDKMQMLDQNPGSIGDLADEHESLGRLGLGAPRTISKGRRYECYEHDEEALSAYEKHLLRVSRGEELS